MHRLRSGFPKSTFIVESMISTVRVFEIDNHQAGWPSADA